jgi:acyl carrier protein
MRGVQDDVRSFVISNFLYGRENGLCDDDSFLEMGIIDSTGMLELVGFLEKNYGIQVEDADLVPENLDSVTLLAQFVRRKLQQPGFAPGCELERQTA